MATDTQVEVVMPQMGVSVSEGTITKWLKSEGEPIARDESLLEISTDKVDTEIPSPAEGVVAKILVQEGETVEVGTVLAVIAPEGAAVVSSRGARSRARDRRKRPRRSRPSRAPRATRPWLRLPPPPARRSRAAAGRAGSGVGQRPHLRLAGRRPDRVGARRRSERGAGHGHRRPRDEEGHPGVRRGRWPGRGATSRPARAVPAAGARTRAHAGGSSSGSPARPGTAA